MNQGHWDLGGAAFWIFIAVIVAASAWERTRRNAEKHETLRRIIEKTGVIDETKLKELFAPPPAVDWWRVPSAPAGGGYRALRIIGTIVMGIGAALAVMAVLMRIFGPASAQTGAGIALPMAAAIAFLGLAIFLASRYASPPPRDQEHGRD